LNFNSFKFFLDFCSMIVCTKCDIFQAWFMLQLQIYRLLMWVL
jgi:hypothetical protein